MRLFLSIAVSLALLVSAGCASIGRYPVSGEKCSPSDPVKSMSAGECPQVPAS
jgi:hypothetical protein